MNMESSEEIYFWYRDLREATFNDQADLDVMYLDKKNPHQAVAALCGILDNLCNNGFHKGLLLLALSAINGSQIEPIQAYGLDLLIFLFIYFDEDIRKDSDLQEFALDVLSTYHAHVLHNMQRIFHGEKLFPNMRTLTTAEIQSSLLFSLVVVGGEANRMFDQNC